MSRARTRKQEDKTQFLQENTEAVEHETRISVEKNGIFEAVASDGTDPLPLFGDIAFASNKATFLRELETLEGEFYASDRGSEEPNGEDHGGEDNGGEDLEPLPPEGAAIALSKNGIGILGLDEMPYGEDGPKPPRESLALDEDEALGFMLGGVRRGPEKPPIEQRTAEPLWEENDFGLSGMNIEFEVLNNKEGTVSLVMFDNNELTRTLEQPPFIMTEIEIGAGQKGRVEDIGFYLPDGPLYDGFEIFVEGDVQIGLVGVDYSTDGDASPDVT